MTDFEIMKRALELAERGKCSVSPNPMVGSIIVKSGKIIAEGWHRKSGMDHAEIIALKKAGNKAKNSRLFVTLEPCFHYSKTPPCVDAIIKSGVKEVIIAMKDPNPLTNGKSIKKLIKSGIKVKNGIMLQQAERLNEVFIKNIKYKMPYVTAKLAQTLDGKIATRTGSSKWITSPKTRRFTHELRDEFDAILVGSGTLLKDDPLLSGIKKNKELKKIIIDSSLELKINAKIFKKTKPENCIIATTKKADSYKIEILRKKGINIILCPLKNNRVDLKWLFKKLTEIKISSILIEGGAKIIGSALKESLVDKIMFFIAPKIVGDSNALSSVTGIDTLNINKTINLKDISFVKINNDIGVFGYVFRNS